MKKLDKKQVPQFIALCVITAGLSGYLVIHLVAPGPVSAGTRGSAAAPAPVPAAGQVAGAGTATPGAATVPGGTATAPGDATDTGDAPPPSPAMHDPFVVGYVDPAALTGAAAPKAPALPKMPPAGKQIASTGQTGPMPVSFPGAPALPGSLSSFAANTEPTQPAAPMRTLPAAPAAPALPAAPAAPLWVVTGVLQGDTGKIAILRSGEARRIVRSGDFVDSTYRVTGVTRTSVSLRHGATTYQLVLGAAKAAPSAVPAAVPMPSLPKALQQPVSLPLPQSAAIIDSTIIPVYHLHRAKAMLSHLKRQGSGLSLTAETLSVPKPALCPKNVSPLKVASAISLGLRLLDGSVLAQNHKE